MQRAGGWLEEVKAALAKGLPLFKATPAVKAHGIRQEEEALRRRGLLAHAARLRNAKRNRKSRGKERAAPGDKGANKKKKEHPSAHAAEHAEAEEKAMLEERWGKIKEEESKMEEEEAAAVAVATALHKQVCASIRIRMR
jgi:hypothetical protein